MTKPERARVEAFLRDLARLCVAHGVSIHRGRATLPSTDGAWQVDLRVGHETGRAIVYSTETTETTLAGVEVDASQPPF